VARLRYLPLILAALFNINGTCRDYLQVKIFSEESIARTIGDLGKDGTIFMHILHGIPYEKIAKRFNMTVEEVKAIAHSGHALLMYYKDLGV